MKDHISIILLLICLLLSAFSGCLDDENNGDDDDIPTSIPAPTWEPGKFWVYAFTTPDEIDIATRMVVAQDDGTNHQVGTANMDEAMRHAVLNYNPLLGRVELNNFSVYENGELQTLFQFPLTKDSSWSFSFLGVEGWEARVESITRTTIPATGSTIIVDIRATAPGGEVMDYSFDVAAGWVHLMRAYNVDGSTLVNMTLVSHGSGHTGEAYFIRARDLLDESYSSPPPVVELYDTFLDSGHPTDGDFDRLIIYLNIQAGGGSSGSLTLRDHSSAIGYNFIINEDSNGNHIDDIEDQSGEWTLEVNLEGSTSVRIRIAGGIWNIWTV